MPNPTRFSALALVAFLFLTAPAAAQQRGPLYIVGEHIRHKRARVRKPAPTKDFVSVGEALSTAEATPATKSGE